MSEAASRALDAYLRFWTGLTRDTVPQLRALAAADMRFKDPFNDVRGVDAVIRIMVSTFDHGAPRLTVLDRALSGDSGYVRWRYVVERGGLAPWIFEGMSEIRFDADRRVVAHIDHWDASEQFYGHIPVLGALIRLVRRRLQA